MTLISIEMLGLIAPAFAAGLVVVSTHVPLGQEVLKRGIIFIDLAIAQIAALGMIFSLVVFDLEEGLGPLGIAMIFALAGGGIFALLERIVPKYQEALIGSAFILSASLIILLLANNPHGGEEIHGLLAGQILLVSWEQIFITSLIYAVFLLFWFTRKDQRSLIFYMAFPIVVTLSVQLVGIYMVFASLILPALGALRYKNRLAAGYSIAAITVTLGLAVSVGSDLPAGPVIVCVFAAVALMAAIVWPKTRSVLLTMYGRSK